VRPFDDTSWVPSRNDIAKTVWAWIVPDRNVGAALVLACSLAAVGTGALAWARR
jgi:hypothetical protein